MSALFSGAVYEPSEDEERLTGQLLRVYEAMQDGHWRTLGEIETITGDPPASISAQLRHLRKPRFGSHVVCKRPRGMRSAGLFEYCVLPPGSTPIGMTAPKRKVKKTGFLAGMMFAARLVVKSSDLAEAKRELKRELQKAAGR